MAELNEIRFSLFVSLMIFPALALDVILSGAHQDFKQKSVIDIDIMNGVKIYRGTLNQLTYEAELGISKVIVYIISRSRCIEILRPAGVARDTRSQIAQELHEMHCELVFLGIENFDDDEYHLIGEFMLDKIQSHPDQKDFTTETIGENRFDYTYRCDVMNFEKYRENAQICGGTFVARLRSISHGALRPVGTNIKEIKLYGYQPAVRQLRWSVTMSGDTYSPDVNLSDPKYNLMMKYPNKKICLLILSGIEYTAVASYRKRCMKRAAMASILEGMSVNGEVMIIMGVFNFDWTEVDIVAQIILKHSEVRGSTPYSVFTCGYGMFNTYYLNVHEDDRRCIRQIPESMALEAIKLLMEEEVKQRAINVYYYEDKWKPLNTLIHLGNGRYVPEFRFNNFTLPCVHQKVAFIVYDQAEMDVPIDYFVVGNAIYELQQSGISVVLIEAINFGLNDMHIIAEWIDRHSGVVNAEQIAVLGGGIFDTIFQSESTTYNTFLNVKKNELEAIRNAYVKSGNAKSVSAAKIDTSNFEVRSFPINILVNGFYEPNIIPDKHTFNTTNERKIYFIITSAYNFQRISAMRDLRSLCTSFRRNIEKYYPNSKWSIFLVGLDNFEDRDSHLFAEFVKRQTIDDRSLQKFVRITNYGIHPHTWEQRYQYRDTAPFDVDFPQSPMQLRFAHHFSLGQADFHMTFDPTETMHKRLNCGKK